MIRLFIVALTLTLLSVLCFIRCNYGQVPIKSTKQSDGQLTAKTKIEAATLIYATKDNVLKIDKNGKVVIDTAKMVIVEYRLSTREVIIPGTRFIWIFEFNNNNPPFLKD